MAANTLANIAAATAAGYTLERFTLPNGFNVTRLSKKTAGMDGKEGGFMQWQGESNTSGQADTNALAGLNKWRDNRYGPDSANASLSPQQAPASSPSTVGVAPTLRANTKDRD